MDCLYDCIKSFVIGRICDVVFRNMVSRLYTFAYQIACSRPLVVKQFPP
jgi:hypothetical protein